MTRAISSEWFTAVKFRVVKYNHETDRYLSSTYAYRVIDRQTGCQVDELPGDLTSKQVKERLMQLDNSIYNDFER